MPKIPQQVFNKCTSKNALLEERKTIKDPLKQSILDYLRIKGELTVKQLMNLTSSSKETVVDYLKILVQQRRVERASVSKKTWRLVDIDF